MATTVARLEAVLGAETRGFDRAMDRSHQKMERVGKAAGVMGAAIFAGLAVVGKRGFDELKSQQAVAAQTAAALLSTGKAAGVSSKQINDMANSLSKKTGIDDEAIQSGENLLLTFRNIRNEAGKNNDMFNQATQATLDLSVAFHRDLNQSAVLVGKALNDPIKGLTSLQRIGVQFTASQREQIKALVASGQSLQAQKIIMAELTAETAKSAEAAGNTLAGQLAKAKNAFDDVAASLVTMLLPAFLNFAEIVRKTSEFLSAHPRLAKAVTVALVVLASALVAARTAQLLMNLAVLANPYVAAAAAAIALGVAIYVFRDKIMNTFNWIKEHWPLLALIILGPIAGAIAQLIVHWRNLVAAIQPAINAVHGINSALQRLVHWLREAVDLVRSLIGWLGKIHVPHISLPHIGVPFGDGAGPGAGSGAGAGRAFNVGRQLWDEIGMGQSLGLSVTSGYRPGAITSHGTPSDHGYNPSRAVDMAGTPLSMARMFAALIGRSEIRQAFYDPMGSIFNGVRSSYREGGHSDHIHIAEYDKGGYLRPGWNLAYNGLGRPEPVGGGDVVIPVSIGGEHIATVVFDMLRRKAKVFENRNGRPAFGGV